MDEVLEDSVTALDTPASLVQDGSVDQDRAGILMASQRGLRGRGIASGRRGTERALAMTDGVCAVVLVIVIVRVLDRDVG